VHELLAAMPDGRELTEWAAFLKGEGEVSELVRTGTDPAVAEAAIWHPKDERT